MLYYIFQYFNLVKTNLLIFFNKHSKIISQISAFFIFIICFCGIIGVFYSEEYTWQFKQNTKKQLNILADLNVCHSFDYLPDFKKNIFNIITSYYEIFINLLTLNKFEVYSNIFNFIKVQTNQIDFYYINTAFLIKQFYLYKMFTYNTVFWFEDYFYRIYLFNGNTPLFFYFGFLFIFSTILSLFLMSFLGFYGVFILNLITLLMFWASLIYYFDLFFIDNILIKINLGKWFVVNIIQPVYFEIFVDSISYSFMFLTVSIALFVYTYTFSYFRYEPNVERLILLINCFVISMVCLVTSGNFFVLFLGWELIGLTSFFLINFWCTRMSTLKSAFKAFVFNKFSDVSLLIAIIIIYFTINDSNINSFLSQTSIFNNYYLNVLDKNYNLIECISFFLIICSFIKSAQFGFHIWLPDSMEAPVPASALIHSATLVSAGVFILLRLAPLFEYSLLVFIITPLVGSFTAFFGGLCSVFQSDIKKILAYSTISHCGFLMVCYSTYITEYTILYLYIHGFFKAAVFLCVGNIIRFSRNYQDFRRMGGFWKYLPFECFASFICLLNLSGLPFSIGFYIKHLLLLGFNTHSFSYYFVLTNILGGATFGLLYSYRLFYYVFFDFKKAKKIIYLQSSRVSLNSNFYTNATLASNLSIFFLLVVSYLTSLYLFNIFLSKSAIGEGLAIFNMNSIQHVEFNKPLLATINNIGFFNWLLFIIITFICCASWRVVFKNYKIIDFFLIITVFFMFFYFFFELI